jgi:transcriptional regulator with XRE-family HTH domain
MFPGGCLHGCCAFLICHLNYKNYHCSHAREDCQPQALQLLPITALEKAPVNGIGQRLKQERVRLKLSQSALGAIGGVETNAQGNYENGLRYPRADYLSRIAKGGVDVAYVVTGRTFPAADVSMKVDELPAAHPATESSESRDRLAGLIERLQNNLHGITTDLYQISRLADAQVESGNTDNRRTQIDSIKGEAEAIALATLRLIFDTSRLT